MLCIRRLPFPLDRNRPTFCLKIKKYFVGFVASTMLVSTCYCIKPVEAIDFSKDEAKYMSLCASGKLTNSNKKTCEEFNSYLKAKNKCCSKYNSNIR